MSRPPPATRRSRSAGSPSPPAPGAALELPVAPLPDRHVAVAAGGGRATACGPGPRSGCRRALHGDELNGIEIIRQVLRLLQPARAGRHARSPCRSSTCSASSTRAATCPTAATSTARSPARHAARSPRSSPTCSSPRSCRAATSASTSTPAATTARTCRSSASTSSIPEVERLAKAFARAGHRATPRTATARCATCVLAPGHPAARVRGRRGPPVQRGGDHGRRRRARCGCSPSSACGAGDDRRRRGPTVVRVEHSHWERARRSRHRAHRRLPGPAGRAGRGARHHRRRPRRAADAGAGDHAGLVLGYTRHPLVSQGDALVHLADRARAHAAASPARRSAATDLTPRQQVPTGGGEATWPAIFPTAARSEGAAGSVGYGGKRADMLRKILPRCLRGGGLLPSPNDPAARRDRGHGGRRRPRGERRFRRHRR